MIFSRARAGRHTAGKGGRHSRRRLAGELGEFGPAAVEPSPAGVGSDYGPYDLSAAPSDDQQRLDLGALRIPALADVEIQLQAGPQGEVHRVQLAHGGSRLQLAAFAAPRSEGIWDEIRATLRSSLAAGGAKLREVDGEYGPELCARVRDASGALDVRHIGIDGPRWFVHGVYLGAAAVDPDQAGPLRDVLRGLVVDRGSEARPVSEALPLRLPPEAAAQLAQPDAAGPDAAGPDADPRVR